MERVSERSEHGVARRGRRKLSIRQTITTPHSTSTRMDLRVYICTLKEYLTRYRASSRSISRKSSFSSSPQNKQQQLLPPSRPMTRLDYDTDQSTLAD